MKLTKTDIHTPERKKLGYQLSLRLSLLAKSQLNKLCEMSGENTQRVIARLINNEAIKQEKQD